MAEPDGDTLLARVRREAGLSQHELARQAGTSRTAISAYEHGRKSPSWDTANRLVSAAGFELDARRRVTFTEVQDARGKTMVIPSVLPRLPIEQALATVTLPLTLNWSQPGRIFRLADRGDRARVYEAVLREGGPADFLSYVDGALLVDLWGELVLPGAVRLAWSPRIGEFLDLPNAVGVA